jgi:hypothetical protein
MSLPGAAHHASLAKRATNPQEAAKHFELAIEELCKVVRDLKDRVDQLEQDR